MICKWDRLSSLSVFSQTNKMKMTGWKACPTEEFRRAIVLIGHCN